MSLVATLAQEFRVMVPEFDKFELRLTQAGTFDTFMRQSNSGATWLTDNLRQRALASAGNTVKLPVINTKDVTIRTTRPLTISDDENTSALYTVTWATLAYGFSMYPAQHYNNDISYQQDFNKKFRAMIVKLLSTLESQAVTAVDGLKTQVIGELVGGHTFASNVVSETGITTLDKSYIISDLQPIMASNNYTGFGMDVVGNQGLNGILRRLDGFGAMNQEDKTLAYAGKNFHFSNSISNATGKNATGYAIEDGTLGVLTRVEPDAVMRSRIPDGHEWDVITLPVLGIPVGTYSYQSAVDASAVAGAATAHLTRTYKQVFDFAFDVAFIGAYNSDRATIAGPVIKFDIDTD